MDPTVSVDTLPMVPLRDAVVFPETMAPFVVGRPGSLKAIAHAEEHTQRLLLLICQRDPLLEKPEAEQVHPIGTVARIVQSIRVSGGNVRMLVEGVKRVRLVGMHEDADGCLLADVVDVPSTVTIEPDVAALAEQVCDLFENYARASPAMNAETLMGKLNIDSPSSMADNISAHLPVAAEMKQDLLDRLFVRDRLERLRTILVTEIERLEVDKSVDKRVKQQLERSQREFYLSEKLKAIHSELGRPDGEDDLDQLAERIAQTPMSAEAAAKAKAELQRLQAMPGVSAEATVVRTYLDWLLDVPWSQRSREKKDLKRAREILEADHHGLEEVKERILEHLAIRRLAPRKRQGTILCFVGPPGVGKTSLAQSIARAVGRKFVRVSLGGVRDEAEIRGHRRTYVGALPGRVIQMMRKAGTRNPVFLLDELDKMSTDFRGDPSAALLEVLDPAQNHAFVDHYLSVEYDLSDVFFIATANVVHTIPAPLLDRLEVIRIAGYTRPEKLAIAQRFLLPRQLEEHGLKGRGVELGRETILAMIENYTREAGVRELDRVITAVCRKAGRKLVDEEWSERYEVEPEHLSELLGLPRFRGSDRVEEDQIGVAVGLAWTAAGGELLHVETSTLAGRGKMHVTGQVGDVMQESAKAALSYVRSRTVELGLEPDFYQNTDVHVHVPQGAIPKDGPSAGVALATSLVSMLCGIPARGDVAMTGEITLRGRVMPVGGIKEKVLAAHRAGIRSIVLPAENEPDLSKLPEEVTRDVEFIVVEHLDDVLKATLERQPVPKAVTEPAREPDVESDRPH